MRPPRTVGHEIAGEVVDTGDGVKGFGPGDRVQVIAAIPCGVCRVCRRGWMTVCPNQESMGYHYDGGFAEFMVVPAKVLAVAGAGPVGCLHVRTARARGAAQVFLADINRARLEVSAAHVRPDEWICGDERRRR